MKDQDTKKKATKLIKQSIGTLNRVVQMIESDQYCFDVIQQIQSVQGTNQKAVELILQEHLKTCVADNISKGGENQEQAIQEILKIIKSK